MNAERLLQHYERIADAPNAIARLRRFILDLAVRGKLVPQDPNDEPANGFRTPGHRGAPFELPGTWQWTEIGEQLELLNGMAFKPTDWAKAGLRIVRIQNLNNAQAPFNFCSPEMARERSLIDNGSFLISWSGTPGTSFGAFIWDRGPAVLNQHIFRCDFKTKAFLAPFLRLAINGRLDEMIAKAHGGVGLQHITKGKLEALLIPLPPLAEQRRIVAKVDELMDLCDQLEAARNIREATRDRLAAASLARLNAPDPETFPADARFALDALPALTARPDQIKQLRQTILDLAVRGKLVPQDPKDEPASELLKRIASEKAQLLEAGELKKLEAIADLTTASDNNDLPAGWAVTNLQSVCSSVTDGDHLPPPKADSGIPFLVIGNVRSQRIDFEGSRFVPEPYYAALDSIRRPRSGDLLYTLVGSYGIPVVVSDDRPFCVQRHIGILRPSKFVDVRFLARAMQSRFIFDQATACATGIAQKTVPLSGLRKLLLRLPPLAEQRRIVARVDELMALCDRLEATLTASADTRRRLLDALLAEALAPSATVQLEAAE